MKNKNALKGGSAIAQNMQLPIPVVTDLFRLIIALRPYDLDDETRAIIARVEAALCAKMEARERRQAFAESIRRR